MIFDVQNTLAGTVSNFAPVGLTVAQVVGTYPGQFTYDMWGNQASLPVDAIGNTLNIDEGLGKEAKVVIEAITAITGAGGSIQWQLVMSDDAAETTNVTVLNAGRAWTVAQIAALNGGSGLGVIERLVIPPFTTKRFLGIQFVITGATITAGSIFAGVVIDEQASLPTQ